MLRLGIYPPVPPVTDINMAAAVVGKSKECRFRYMQTVFLILFQNCLAETFTLMSYVKVEKYTENTGVRNLLRIIVTLNLGVPEYEFQSAVFE